MFSLQSKISLARSTLFQDQPVYVQFYITARCNLTCNQCNIIYANSDVEECNIYQIEHIAENFAKMKVAIVLLTGGEPFARKDLPEIIRAFEKRGEQYLLIKSPPASGKSRALMFIALDKIKNQGIKQKMMIEIGK